MNKIIYNISVVILLFGVILMVHYTTKIKYNKVREILVSGPKNIYDSYVYQERPKTLFKRMFNSLGPWVGRVPNTTLTEENDKIDEGIHNTNVKLRTSPLLLFK